MGIKQKAQLHLLTQLVKLLPRFSDKNLIRMTYIAEKITPTEKKYVRTLRRMFREKHPASVLAKKIIAEKNPKVLRKFIINLFGNSLLLSNGRRREFKKKHGFLPPFFIVISPTMRCNLRCRGCYAGDYTKDQDLPFKTFDKIIKEAKEMGIYLFTISGGEPFFRKDTLKIFEKHSDCYFQVYTNGTLIDKKLAKRLAELGNVVPAISVEGFEYETDDRRGKGVHKAVLKAMKNLKEAGVLFGFSATPTRLNSDILCSDTFIDFYIKHGCSYGWYFQYIPIGLKPDVNLMATPEQRNKLRNRLKDIRSTKPIFIGDFWNDGPYVNGCMAGGRLYLHINCMGDVEPCVFTHFAVDNIKNKTLAEALNSPLFRAIRRKQKDIDNLLTPCLIIDNPNVLREACKESGARPTHPGAETIISNPKIMAHLDNYSKKMHELTEPVWKKQYIKN